MVQGAASSAAGPPRGVIMGQPFPPSQGLVSSAGMLPFTYDSGAAALVYHHMVG